MILSKKKVNTKKVVMPLLGVAMCASVGVYADQNAHWGYTGDVGPKYWGKLSKEFVTCSHGKNQSPIDLTDMVEAKLGTITFAYRKVPLHIINNGHTVQVNYDKGSHITVDGHTYGLRQFHFHSPSEHYINGQSFPLEAHLVHSDEEGNLAVIAVMFSAGKENRFLNTLWEHMPTQEGKENALSEGKISVMDMLPKNKGCYRYNGSLTTPPCSEGVRWMVMQHAMEVSSAQVKKFRSVMHHDNNRPVQSVFARAVLK
jgi:carbonic anhydrase